MKCRPQNDYEAPEHSYDHPELSFWPYFGTQTVKLAGLRSGDAVLDVCCGSGASTIPAAHSVSPKGTVLGVYPSEPLMDLARSKAERLGLDNVQFRNGDFETMPLPIGGFDAVLCAFGILFVRDMTAGLHHMWRLLRPGGRLVLATWGSDLFEPMSTVFWEAVRKERPHFNKGFNCWDVLSEPRRLRRLFSLVGIEFEEIRSEWCDHIMKNPADWWTIVMGSGYRGTIEQLNPHARDRVRRHCEEYLCRTGLKTLRMSVVYGLARKT